MRSIVETDDVTDEEKDRLIGYVNSYHVIWAQGLPKTAESVKEAWTSIASNLSTTERTFEVKLVKKLWKELRDQYVKNVKSKNPSLSDWQYQDALAFLGTEFGPRTKKVKIENDENEQPAKKKKVKEESKEESQAQQPFQLPNMQNAFMQFQMPPFMQQFYTQVPFQNLTTMQHQAIINSGVFAKQIALQQWGSTPKSSVSNESFTTSQNVSNFGQLTSPSVFDHSTNIPSASLNQQIGQSNRVESELKYSDVKPMFDSIRAELIAFIKRLIEFENKLRV